MRKDAFKFTAIGALVLLGVALIVTLVGFWVATTTPGCLMYAYKLGGSAGTTAF
jgi:hypothetical protein